MPADRIRCLQPSQKSAVKSLRPPFRLTVEELMACGYGACMTCVMPVRRPRSGGRIRRTRSSTPGRVPRVPSSTALRSCGTARGRNR